MRRLDIYFTFFWIILGLFVFIYSYRLGVGRIGSPGPGLFPFCLGVIFLLLSFIHLVGELFHRKKEVIMKPDEETSEGVMRLILLVSSLFVYALFLEGLGYLITTFVVLIMLFKIAGNKSWIRVTIYSLSTLIITYLFFTYLGVRFPGGILRSIKLL